MLVKVYEIYPENILRLNKKMINLDFVLKTKDKKRPDSKFFMTYLYEL